MKISFILKIFFALTLFILLERFCHKQTAGFSRSKIGSTFIAASNNSTYPPTFLLDQPYFFLGSGGQCYAFLSADGYTVLKLFKNHHIRLWNWIDSFPPFLRSLFHHFLKNNTHQSPAFYESCQIAYNDFRERSGLIYLHLGKTEHLQKKLTLYDKIGVIHQIDLDTIDFALQRRVESPRRKLRILIREKDEEAAKACIDSLLSLILERYQKGIKDRDPNIRRNLGFIGTQAFEIDIGSFTKEAAPIEPEVYRKEIAQNTAKLYKWLKRHDTELAEYFSQQIEAIK